MKKINIRESLLRFDKDTSCQYDLTSLYEACALDEEDKKKLVQYIDAKDIDATNKLLTNRATEQGFMENLSDDVSDDELASFGVEKETLTENTDADTIEQKIKDKTFDALLKKYDEEFVHDYCEVQVGEVEDNIQVRVNAEVSYSDLEDLGTELTKVITEFDPRAYFEPECPGRLVAYVRKDQSEDIVDEAILKEWTDKFNAVTSRKELFDVYNELVKVRDNINSGTLMAIYYLVDDKIDEFPEKKETDDIDFDSEVTFDESLNEATGYEWDGTPVQVKDWAKDYVLVKNWTIYDVLDSEVLSEDDLLQGGLITQEQYDAYNNEDYDAIPDDITIKKGTHLNYEGITSYGGYTFAQFSLPEYNNIVISISFDGWRWELAELVSAPMSDEEKAKRAASKERNRKNKELGLDKNGNPIMYQFSSSLGVKYKIDNTYYTGSVNSSQLMIAFKSVKQASEFIKKLKDVTGYWRILSDRDIKKLRSNIVTKYEWVEVDTDCGKAFITTEAKSKIDSSKNNTKQLITNLKSKITEAKNDIEHDINRHKKSLKNDTEEKLWDELENVYKQVDKKLKDKYSISGVKDSFYAFCGQFYNTFTAWITANKISWERDISHINLNELEKETIFLLKSEISKLPYFNNVDIEIVERDTENHKIPFTKIELNTTPSLDEVIKSQTPQLSDEDINKIKEPYERAIKHYQSQINKLESQTSKTESLTEEMTSWTDVYEKFTDIVRKNFPNTELINKEVEDLYNEHKGETMWDEAYYRWCQGDESLTEDVEKRDIFCVDCDTVTTHTYKGSFKDGSKIKGRYICTRCGCENNDEPLTEDNEPEKYTLLQDEREFNKFTVGGKDVPYTSHEEAKAHMKEDYPMESFIDELVEYMKGNDLYYSPYVNEEDKLVITVEDGDWKHEHLYLDRLIGKFFFNRGLIVDINSEVIESDELSDCYSAHHIYELTDLIFSMSISESLENIDTNSDDDLDEGVLSDIANVGKAVAKEVKNSKTFQKHVQPKVDKVKNSDAYKNISNAVKDTDTYKNVKQGIDTAKDVVKSNVADKNRKATDISFNVDGKDYRASELKYKLNGKDISADEVAKMNAFQRRKVEMEVPEGVKPIKEGVASATQINWDDDDDFTYDAEVWEDAMGVVSNKDFFAEGSDYTWVERVSSVETLDFDNWAVWSALNQDTGETQYFVVDEDTEFIDWGPVDTEQEAKEFLQSKVDEYNLDESLDDEVTIDDVADAFKVNGPHSRQDKIPEAIDTAFNIINIKDSMRPKSYRLDRVDDNIQFTWVTQEPFKLYDLMLFEKELIRAFTEIAKSVGYHKEFTVMYDVTDRDGEDHRADDIIINGSVDESLDEAWVMSLSDATKDLNDADKNGFYKVMDNITCDPSKCPLDQLENEVGEIAARYTDGNASPEYEGEDFADEEYSGSKIYNAILKLYGRENELSQGE